MKKKTLNKLVRDKIPNQIIKKGKSFKARKSNNILLDLADKLVEESKEACQAIYELDQEGSLGPCGCCEEAFENVIEEMADVIEVWSTICKKHGGISQNAILKKVAEKRNKNGGFDDEIYLEWVEE